MSQLIGLGSTRFADHNRTDYCSSGKQLPFVLDILADIIETEPK